MNKGMCTWIRHHYSCAHMYKEMCNITYSCVWRHVLWRIQICVCNVTYSCVWWYPTWMSTVTHHTRNETCPIKICGVPHEWVPSRITNTLRLVPSRFVVSPHECVTSLITNVYDGIPRAGKTTASAEMCDVTYPRVPDDTWRETSMCVCDVTHSYVSHFPGVIVSMCLTTYDVKHPFVCATWLIHVFHVFQARWEPWWKCAMWCVHMSDDTRLDPSRFVCVTWLSRVYDVIYIYMYVYMYICI